jgi:hypothetical protein
MEREQADLQNSYDRVAEEYAKRFYKAGLIVEQVLRSHSEPERYASPRFSSV